MKKCNKCKDDKEEEDFSWRNKNEGIRKTNCKDCDKKYKKSYYKKNRKELIKYSTESSKNIRIRNREFVFNYLKNNPCVDCGESDPIVLDFDHKSGKDKLNNVSYLVGTGAYGLKKIENDFIMPLFFTFLAKSNSFIVLISIQP